MLTDNTLSKAIPAKNISTIPINNFNMLKSYKEWSSQLKEMTGVNPAWVRGARPEEQWKNEEVKKAFDKVSLAVNSAFETVLKAMPKAPEEPPVAPSSPPAPKEEPKGPAAPYRRFAGQSWKTASGQAPGQPGPSLAAPKSSGSWRPSVQWVGANVPEHVMSESMDLMMNTIGELKKTIEVAFKELDGKVAMPPAAQEKESGAMPEPKAERLPDHPPAEEPTATPEPEIKPTATDVKPTAPAFKQKELGFGEPPAPEVKPEPMKDVKLPKLKDPIRKNNKAAAADALAEIAKNFPDKKAAMEKIMATLTPAPGKKNNSVERRVKLEILETLEGLDPEYGWLKLIGNSKWRDHVVPVLEKALRGGSDIVAVRKPKTPAVEAPMATPAVAPRPNRRGNEAFEDYAAWAKRQNQSDMHGDSTEVPGETVNEGEGNQSEPSEHSSSDSASKRSGKSSRNASSSRRAALIRS